MQRCGDYVLEGLLGRGSTGTVYRARHEGREDPVALKWVSRVGDPDLARRLREEASRLAALDHPHIVDVLEVVEDEGGLGIAMQLMGGGSLGWLVEQRRRPALEEVVGLAAAVAGALASAHSRGLLHCDVKPSNILFDELGDARLSDFGLSRCMAPEGLRSALLIGTAEYLDPAVAGGAELSPASDVYSLGVICYELLTGGLPYQATTPLATLRAADRGRFQPLSEVRPDLPRGLASVVERAMAKRPVSRPTAAELVAGIDEAGCRSPSVARAGVDASDGPRLVQARRPSPQRAWSTPVRLHRRRASLAALTVAGATLGLASVWSVVVPGARAHRQDRACASTAAATPTARSDAATSTTDADVSGDGCQVPIWWSSSTLTVSQKAGAPPVRFSLGQPGDELLLGHWDCARKATPALYRPSTGQVFYFGEWATPVHDVGPSEVEQTTVTDGMPHVARDRAVGCDRVVVSGTKDPMRP